MNKIEEKKKYMWQRQANKCRNLLNDKYFTEKEKTTTNRNQIRDTCSYISLY